VVLYGSAICLHCLTTSGVINKQNTFFNTLRREFWPDLGSGGTASTTHRRVGAILQPFFFCLLELAPTLKCACALVGMPEFATQIPFYLKGYNDGPDSVVVMIMIE